MGSLDRYIFRQTMAAFVLVLVTLTGVIWMTQALRGIDVMTGKGQTILVFLGLTSLAIPFLVLVIAPIALVIAVAYVLNKLATDSEVIVMNAAGTTPWQLFRPFFMVTVIVSVMIFIISAYVAPDGYRRLKSWQREITADVVSNILQTGRFMEVEANLTLRVRERQPGGIMAGIFIDDRRDPRERITIIAERGTVLKNEKGSYLILDDGNLQRFEASRKDPVLVEFDRYAFDMSRFSTAPKDVSYSIRERYLWELIDPDPNDALYKLVPGQFRAEMHDRFASLLYPYAFVALTFAFLGTPRTTRQSSRLAISNAITAVGVLRLIGFACTVMAARSALAAPVQYGIILATLAFSAWAILKVIPLELPPGLIQGATNVFSRIADLRGLLRFSPR